jgi:hypothetical protein
MELVGSMPAEVEGSEPQKFWYRCSRCKHSALLDIASVGKEKKGASAIIDRAACTEYSADKLFKIGEEIYHAGLDDVGRVVRKDKTSGGIHSIVVTFERTGERKLLENTHDLPVDDSEVVPVTG